MAKKYKDIIEDLTTLDLQGSLDVVINNLQEEKGKYENLGYTNLKIVEEYEYDYSELQLIGSRKETDKEREKRLAKSRKARETRKRNLETKMEKDRILYLKLKEKFEDE